MILEIGTHIYYNNERGEVLNFNPDGTRVLILLYESQTVSGRPFQTWAQRDEVTIDYQFYRDRKLDNLL